MLHPREPRGLRPGDRQGIQRIRDGLQMLLREMEIQHGVPDFRMAQQELNRAEVSAGFKEMCCVTVSVTLIVSNKMRP